MRSSTALLPVLALAILGWRGPAAQADTLRAAERPALHEVRVDLGAYETSATWLYVVKKGDSLGEIARRELGTTRRQAEIARLNAGAAPLMLRVGQRLLMPPRSVATRVDAKATTWWDFFRWSPADRASAPARVFPRIAMEGLKPGTRLYAVPHDIVEGLIAPSKGKGFDGTVLDRHPRVARSPEFGVARIAARRDPGAQDVSRYEVLSIDGRIMGLKAMAAIRPEAPAKAVAAPGGSGSGTTTAFVVLLVLLALVGAVLLVARRVRAHETAV